MRGAVRGLIAGLLLSLIEICVVAAHDYALFLSTRELMRYALLALMLQPGIGALLGLVASLGSRLPGMRLVVFLGASTLGSLTLQALTAGRRARDLPGRTIGIVLGGVAMGFALSWLATFVQRRVRDAQPARALAIASFAVATCAVVVDALVLRRLYPAFHAALAGWAWIAALSAVALAWPRTRLDQYAQRVVLAGAVLALGGVMQLGAIAALPGRRFPIEQAAPLTSKLLARWPAPSAPRMEPAPPVQSSAATAPTATAKRARAATIDLRDRDVLLITIDALRADRLAAYGGRGGLTPRLDALAAESRVFQRAYTPTPHTSYALISLFSGKPIGLLYALASLRQEPVTLPMLLRRHGYRTAAFYPPAIFYVDSDRFASLAEQHLGFEYVKAMYASGSERVGQLEDYLRDSDPKRPLFIWMHLFEPHEPYEPAPPYAPPAGSTPEQRYDGEVRAADAAAGELIATFRAARPSATVIVSADHGEEFGDHGGHHHGTTLFDEQARVPLLWSSPGQLAPGSSSVPVDLIDLPTTLLSALGIPKDARMLGDDLGAVLADASAQGPALAFASLPELAMTTDGRLKVLCTHRTGSCQLFDLVNDPRERVDLSAERAADVARLRAGWNAFVAEVPRAEALDLSGQAWPAALARARLGDASVSHELTALLGSPRAEVRAEAASALGELGAAHAKPVLARMLDSEPEPSVAAAVAIAALRLGHEPASERVLMLLQGEGDPPPEHARKAAVALARAGRCEGEPVLVRSAAAAQLAEPERLAALDALGTCKQVTRETLTALAALFGESRLREPVARTLGTLGDKRAIPVLRKALKDEVYPEARAAEVAALQALGDGATAERLRKQSEARSLKTKPKEP
jgi:arylsulfatase A-like enzyme/HEAT repeat protein